MLLLEGKGGRLMAGPDPRFEGGGRSQMLTPLLGHPEGETRERPLSPGQPFYKVALWAGGV